MTDRERNRQQWKALRAPIAKQALALRRSYRTPVKYVYLVNRLAFCRGKACKLGELLTFLDTMRSAELNGEDALIWKLTYG